MATAQQGIRYRAAPARHVSEANRAKRVPLVHFVSLVLRAQAWRSNRIYRQPRGL